jgi:hypothetical protein
VCACACARGAGAQRAPGGAALERAADTQLWPDVTVNVRVRPGVALHFFGTARIGHELSAPAAEHLGVGVQYAPSEYLTTLVSYRFISAQPAPLLRATEHRLFFDVTPRLPLGHKFVVTDRHRVERRDINGVVSHRYRNRAQLERECVVRERRVTPYVAGEIFYDDRFHGWTQRRLFVGSRWLLGKHLTLDTHYQLLLDDRARPGKLNIVGVLFRFEY